MDFEKACPQFVQIDANAFDMLTVPLSCPICGKAVTDADGAIADDFCEHILYMGSTEVDAIRYNKSTGMDAMNPPLYFSNAEELRNEVMQYAEAKDRTEEEDKILAFYRGLDNACVVFCYHHIEQCCVSTNVADCVAVRFPRAEKVPSIGDWLDEQNRNK